MDTDFIEVYFQGDHRASLFMIIAGAISFIAGIYCRLGMRKLFVHGLAYPITFVAIIQLAVGIAVYLRTPHDLEAVRNIVVLEPNRINDEELPRIERVMRNFNTYRYIEIAFIVTGLLLTILRSPSPVLKGLGFGLLFQGIVMLLVDHAAEQRAATYRSELLRVVSPLERKS